MQLTSELEVAAAARDAMLAQRNEANTALAGEPHRIEQAEHTIGLSTSGRADQRSGNNKLKTDQERQFTDLVVSISCALAHSSVGWLQGQHRDEIDELNENFATVRQKRYTGPALTSELAGVRRWACVSRGCTGSDKPSSLLRSGKIKSS